MKEESDRKTLILFDVYSEAGPCIRYKLMKHVKAKYQVSIQHYTDRQQDFLVDGVRTRLHYVVGYS